MLKKFTLYTVIFCILIPDSYYGFNTFQHTIHINRDKPPKKSTNSRSKHYLIKDHSQLFQTKTINEDQKTIQKNVNRKQTKTTKTD